MRSMEQDGLARFYLTRKVFRCRSVVLALIKAAQADYYLKNPRAPRRRTSAQPRTRALKSTDPGAEASFDPVEKKEEVALLSLFESVSVSYTHPTLPTIYSV